MISKFFTLFVFAAMASVPLVSAAQGNLQNIYDLVAAVRGIASNLVIAVFLIAVLVFGWGIVKYLTAAGDAAKLKAARGFLWWGVIGMFVLSALWGILTFIGEAFDVSTNLEGTIKPPQVRTRSGP